MLKLFRKLLGSKKGQGMTEYIILIVMIAVAAIVVWRYFGEDIKRITGGARTKIHNEVGKVDTSEKAAGGKWNGPSW